MTQTGEYERVATQPGKIVFEREFKPPMGLGFVTKTERCVVTLTELQGRVNVSIAGRCLADRMTALRAAVQGRSMATEALNAEFGAVDVMPEVEAVSSEPPPPVVDPAGRSRPAEPPVWAPPSAPPAPSPASTAQASSPKKPAPVARSAEAGPILPMPGSLQESLADSVDSSSTRALVLDLGTDTAVHLDRRLVVGREPRLTAVAPHGVNPAMTAAVVPIDDFTLSRTHCWIEPSRGCADL